MKFGGKRRSGVEEPTPESDGDTVDLLAAASPIEAPRRRRARKFGLLAMAVVLWSAGVLATGAYLGYRAADNSAPDPQAITQVTVVVQHVDLPEVGPNDQSQAPAPDVVGLDIDTARSVFAGFGSFEVNVESRPAAGPEGVVVDQDPPPGAKLTGAVTLVLSVLSNVPDVTGATAADARKKLEDLGANVFVRQEYQPGATPGLVLATEPPVGELMPLEVVLVVAQAPAAVALADVVAVSSRCSIGTFSGNGVTYDNSLSCSSSTPGTVNEYNLADGIEQFTAVAAISDSESLGDLVRIEVLGDGVSLFDGTVAFGQSVPIDVSVAGVLRLQIRVSVVDPVIGSAQVVIGDASLIGSAQAVDSLEVRP